jgi:NAD+ kinase
MKILLVSRIDDQRAIDYTESLARELHADGHGVQVAGPGGELAGEFHADLAAVVGGDGTILLTVRRMKQQIPIIGINWGEVGFLADLEPDEAPGFLRYLPTDFPRERRMRLALWRDGVCCGEALNEALIVTGRPAKMLRFLVIVDGVPAERFRGDGLLISTPTGSTAYAMSAGGPIVDPRIEAFLLVPLAPFHLSSRPHLISSDRSVEIRLESAKPASMVIDGQKTIDLGTDAAIQVKKATEPAIFVDAGKNFFEKVNSKLRQL